MNIIRALLALLALAALMALLAAATVYLEVPLI